MKTPEEAVELLAHAVAKKGDAYVDTSNTYFHDNGHPACIVGHVLRELGYKKRSLTEGVMALMPAGFPEGSSKIFNTAIKMNDAGRPWGDILINAKEIAREMQDDAGEGS